MNVEKRADKRRPSSSRIVQPSQG